MYEILHTLTKCNFETLMNRPDGNSTELFEIDNLRLDHLAWVLYFVRKLIPYKSGTVVSGKNKLRTNSESAKSRNGPPAEFYRVINELWLFRNEIYWIGFKKCIGETTYPKTSKHRNNILAYKLPHIRAFKCIISDLQ